MAFAFVYISEAHAAGEWPVGHDVPVNQPKNSAERVTVDMPEATNFHKAYACWPLRWYTIGAEDQKLDTIAQPRKSAYHLQELIAWVLAQAVP